MPPLSPHVDEALSVFDQRRGRSLAVEAESGKCNVAERRLVIGRFRYVAADLSDPGADFRTPPTWADARRNRGPRPQHSNWVLHRERTSASQLRRDRLLHSIGNLTLVTGSLNTPMSNNGWDFKRGEIEKHSVLHLNRRLLEMKVEGWDEAAIAARARQLAARAIEVWPR